MVIWCPLTDDDLDLLALLSEGKTITEASVAMGWTLGVGSRRLSKVRAHVGATTAIEAVAIAVRERWIA